MKLGCISQCIWPQCKVDSLQPLGARVEQSLAHVSQEVLDGSLSNAILEVGIYPTKGELLPCFMACLLEGVVVELSVVAIVVWVFDSVFCCVLLNDKLGSKCFVGLVVKLEVDKLEAAKVVDEDGGTLVVLLGEFAFQLRKKSHFR